MDYNFNDNVRYICTDTVNEIRFEKKRVSRIFLSLTLSAFFAYITVLCISILLYFFVPYIYDNSMVQLLINDSYTVIAIGLFLVFSAAVPSQKPAPTGSMTFGRFMVIFIISLSLMIIGAIVGNIFSFFVGAFTGNEIENTVNAIMENYSISEIFVSVVIIAPITEELMFRKLLINKISRYGTVFSVVVSGVVFGAFHGNFYQFFYAAAIGMVLAYVYCVYGKLRYTILLHSAINFVGSIVAMYFSEMTESANIFAGIIAGLYNIAYMACVPVGIILLIKELKMLRFYTSDGVLVSPMRTLSRNVGLIIYTVYTVIMFALSIFIG